MRRQREGLAELRTFIEYAEPKYLRDQLELLAGPLGLGHQQLEQLRQLDPDQLGQALRAHAEGRRQQARALQARAAEERAAEAALDLGCQVEWDGTAARLDPELLLDRLAGHPTARLVAFEGPGWTVAVPKQKLREARRALGRLPGLEVQVDEHGLHFRWHGGRGGLDLYPQPIRRELGPPLLVCLRPPEPAVVERHQHAAAVWTGKRASARPKGGAWLGQVLSDLGLIG